MSLMPLFGGKSAGEWRELPQVAEHVAEIGGEKYTVHCGFELWGGARENITNSETLWWAWHEEVEKVLTFDDIAAAYGYVRS